MNWMRIFYGSIVLGSALVFGCSSPKDTVQGLANVSSNATNKGGRVPESRVSNRPGNIDGKVYVAMYHHIGDNKDRIWFRKASEFESDLARFDRMGFRPVTASAYLSGKMNLPPGASPVVMTFDDSNPDQIRLLADGSLDPTCFTGIWSAFAKSHPEFPIHATFFVLPKVMFGQPKWQDKKLKMLRDWGSELGNHTVTHSLLRHKTDDQVMEEIGEAAEDLVKLGRNDAAPLALPYGSSPHNKELLHGFEWHGKRVEPTGVFLVGSNPAPSTNDPKFNRYAIPRIQANGLKFGLTYWLDAAAKGRVKLYVEP